MANSCAFFLKVSISSALVPFSFSGDRAVAGVLVVSGVVGLSGESPKSSSTELNKSELEDDRDLTLSIRGGLTSGNLASCSFWVSGGGESGLVIMFPPDAAAGTGRAKSSWVNSVI